MLIKNLKCVFTGEGFAKKEGRHPKFEDAGFIAGPIDIEIEKGNIKNIGKNLSGDETFDGTGLSATAGFIDSHTHTLFAGERSAEYFMRWIGKSYVEISDAGGGIHNTVAATKKLSDEQLLALSNSRIKSILRSGTTTLEIKSGYGSNCTDELRYLRLLSKCKKELGENNIFLTFLGLHSIPKGQDEGKFVDDMIASLDTVEKDTDCSFVDCFPEKGFFSLEQSLRFIKEAKKKGLLPKIHADEITDMGASSAFIKEGALSVDHLQRISDEAVQLLTKENTVATLLPATSFYLGLDYANARKLLDAGARVALATDFNPGTAPNPSMNFTQLLAASQMKMDPAEIFCASTYSAATALGLEDRGTLEVGKKADIALWDLESTEEGLCELFVQGPEPKAVFISGNSL